MVSIIGFVQTAYRKGVFVGFIYAMMTGAALAAYLSPEQFNAQSSMEIAATSRQTADLLQRHPDADILLFPEDRTQPIRIRHALPQCWIEKGPTDQFQGQAQPGEFYVFQIGVFAARKPVTDIQVRYTDLQGPAGRIISTETIRCFNLGGTDWLGRSFQKRISVAQGQVQALWFGVQIPQHLPSGPYHGKLVIQANPSSARIPIELTVTVSGEALSDSGDADLWRHARLRWLDSSLGLDTEVTKPYTPLEVTENTISCLGRQIVLGQTGLPRRLATLFSHTDSALGTQGTDLLTGPVELKIETDQGIVPWQDGTPEIIRQEAGEVQWQSQSTGPGFDLTVQAHMEYDGHVSYRMTVKARRAASVRDIRLEIPLQRTVAKYMMGMGHKGGLCPPDFQWKWDRAKHQDSLWVGDVHAGLQCKLKGPDYARPLVNIYYRYKPLKLPDAWYNAGRGGCSLSQVNDDTVRVQAFSGPRRLAAGQSLHFEVDLLLTPVRPLDTRAHWRNRYYHNGDGASLPTWLGAARQGGAQIVNIHHGNDLNPFINYPFHEQTVTDLTTYLESVHQAGLKGKIYYTVRELTNHMTELWALRSLGDEVFIAGAGNTERTIINPKGADPWLQTHLGTDYVPAWRHTFRSGQYQGHVDAAIVTNGMSRWHNYYVEGLQWLVQNTAMDGIYIDDVAYDRKVMQRVRKVLDRNRPECLIDVHSWNHFNGRAGFASCANLYMEHFPYIDSIWFGEGFNYNESPDYWLVEISGIPFGLMGQMLQGGGNPWRGMIYGMSTRLPWSGNPTAIWQFWDQFEIQDKQMIGYWSEDCPVRTDHDDVLATVYRGEQRSLVSVASWAKKTVQYRLVIDWDTLGLDRTQTSLYAPSIPDFQSAKTWGIDDAIDIEPGRGWLLVLDTQD